MATKHAFVFPGQGAQFVGMGKELAKSFPVARHVLEEVDETLKQSLSRIIFEGPEEELTLTANTQPALMATSLAVVAVIESEGKISLADKCDFMAGHSLGEYSALAAAKALSISDTARLLRIRGDAMQQAVPTGQGSMAAIIGVEFPTAMEIAEAAAQGEVCQAANDNGGGQVVLSGTTGAIDRAVDLAGDFGAKRAVKLAVSAPFHSRLMESAASRMQEALTEATVNVPNVPIISNVTAQPETDPQRIKDLLVEQVTGTVRWRESVICLKNNNVETVCELGAGKVLSGLIRRIDKEIAVSSIQTPEDIEDFLSKHA